MFKKITFLILLVIGLFVSQKTNAQTIISSSGASYKQASGSISFTLGQIQQATLIKDGTILSQGFHQPFLLISGITSLPDLGLEIRAFPNPTTAQLQLNFTKGFDPDQYQIQLYDLFGHLHFQTKLSTAQSEIDLSNKTSGTYLLKILSKGQAIHTFKILKAK
jgi:hypothetical protein